MAEKRSDGIFTKGDGGTPIWAVQTSASGALVSNGAYGPLQLDENGQLRITGSLTTSPVSNQTVNISQVGGQTAATGGAGILSVSLGGTSTVALASGAAVIGALTANQTVNLAQVGGQTAATAAAGRLEVGVAGTVTVDGSGVTQPISGTVTANAGTGTFGSNISQIGGQTAATAATGVIKVGADLFQVGGSATVTASAGIQRTHALTAIDVGTMYSSGLAKKPVFLQISASASGSNLLVASAASTSYLILAYNLMSNGAVNAQFLSSATPMGGITYMPTAGVGKVAPFCPVGWMQTTAAHSLNLHLSANIAVGGEIVYVAI